MRKIEAFSKEYFELLTKHRDLTKVFAFATEILVVVDGQAIQITKPKPAQKKPARSEKPPATKGPATKGSATGNTKQAGPASRN